MVTMALHPCKQTGMLKRDVAIWRIVSGDGCCGCTCCKPPCFADTSAFPRALLLRDTPQYVDQQLRRQLMLQLAHLCVLQHHQTSSDVSLLGTLATCAKCIHPGCCNSRDKLHGTGESARV